MSIISKICSKCKEDKSLEMFSGDKKGILGKHSQCKQCAKNYRLEQGIGEHAKQQKVWREKNKEGYKLYARIWNYNKLGIKITKDEYLKALKINGNKCAICNSPPPKSSVLCLDHDHDTNKIRGFLCNDCNIGLGKFKDNTTTLCLAVKYLRNSTEEQVLNTYR